MLAKFSVKKPYTVLVGVILVIVLGVVSLMKMSADLLPNINLPYVIIMTTDVGASPETVEMVVTSPIESAMATISNIENISSMSSENYSVVILEFAQTANMDSIAVDIRESLDQLESYWDDSVGTPIIMKINPNMLPAMIAAVGVEGMDESEISEFAEDKIIPALESVEGVASVNATGLVEESLHVVIRKEKIDEVNEKIFALIDDKFEDAYKQIADGKEELDENKSKLTDALKEIQKGENELKNAQGKLDSSKAELQTKKEETLTELANTKLTLLTGKADIESAVTTANTNISYINGLWSGYSELMKNYNSAMPQLDAGIAQIDTAIGGIDYMLSLGGMSEEEMAAYGAQKVALSEQRAQLAGQRDQLVTAKSTLENEISALAGGVSSAQVNTYVSTQNTIISKLQDSLKQVNDGIVQVYKGESEAVIGFANGLSQLDLAQYQLDLNKQKVSDAKAELESGMDAIEDGYTKLDDAQKEAEKAKEDAKESANMVNILTIDTVSSLLSAQNFSMPAGYITEGDDSYLVRIGDKPDSTEELENLPLMKIPMTDKDIIRLSDVADVFVSSNIDEVYTNVNQKKGVVLSLQKQTGYSTGDVSDAINDKFDSLKKQYEGLSLIPLMDQGIYIDLVMDTIFENVLYGAILAILVLILFLRDLRPTLIIAFSIPISLIAAIVCMYFSNVTLNIISLSGLALGVGMLVDNSIVVIENIYRLRNEGMGIKEAAIEGTKEVAGAIFASTLTTVCVFLPIVFTEGITRQLFVDMGLTIAYSLLASLVVAMTVVPALASKTLKKIKAVKTDSDRGFYKGYKAFLNGCIKCKLLVFLVVIGLLGASVYLAWQNGTAYFPEMASTQITVSVSLAKDSELTDVTKETDQLIEGIYNMEDVVDIGAMASSSALSMLGGMQTNSADTTSTTIYVTTVEDPVLSTGEMVKEIEKLAADIEGIKVSVETSTMDMSALGGSGISLEIKGRDLDTLYSLSKEAADILRNTEGIAEVKGVEQNSDPEFRITVDKDKAILKGLTVAQVFAQIYPELSENGVATTLSTATDDISVYVEEEADAELTILKLKNFKLKITDADGNEDTVMLREIADFTNTFVLGTINRTNQTRYVTVSASLAEGYNIGLVSIDAEKNMEALDVPEGYSAEFNGENEMIMEAIRQLALMLVLAIVFIYLIMVAQFQSLSAPFIIMFTMPLAFTGGFLALFFTGNEISIISMIGFVMLSGIIVNNGIVLVDYINQRREAGVSKREAILDAGATRLRPVLMTALTTILGLLMMAFSTKMGADMSRPLAITVIGGMVYGTLMTLIVIPCVYDLFTKKDPRDKKRKKKSKAEPVEPIVEEPVAEEIVVEEPIVEEPVAEEIVVEEPIAEEPAAVETVVEEPEKAAAVAEETKETSTKEETGKKGEAKLKPLPQINKGSNPYLSYYDGKNKK